ncbi:MAG TPA: glycoside hydrolase, partial [Sphaerochaeta sp.]|nr:glycoside hydrolase [Sphaerochaeta sp.]
VHWEGPFVIFTPPAGFWGTNNFWAPEVHLYQDKYYLFASFKSDVRRRGTQILVSSSPLGPFVPLGDRPA